MDHWNQIVCLALLISNCFMVIVFVMDYLIISKHLKVVFQIAKHAIQVALLALIKLLKDALVAI